MSEQQYVAVAKGNMDYIKSMLRRCEDAGIPASLDRCKGTS